MENETIDEMIKYYGYRLSELENMYHNLTGVYPLYDCIEFWDDRAVEVADCMIQLMWDLKNLKADKESK